MCVGPVPVALTPSWQVPQGSTVPAWSKLAGRQAAVEWQVSQVSALGMCATVLPVALVPSWQLAQVPMTSAWSTLGTGDQPP
jgi:hypothetical protein